MRIDEKRALLAYIEKNNDGTPRAESLISLLKHECFFADCDVFSVSVTDLSDLDGSGTGIRLREKLGKARGEGYTMEDCVRVSGAIADLVCDEFGENLVNAIEYQL